MGKQTQKLESRQKRPVRVQMVATRQLMWSMLVNNQSQQCGMVM